MNKKLTLKKESLKNLSPAQLAEVAGGTDSDIGPFGPASGGCNAF